MLGQIDYAGLATLLTAIALVIGASAAAYSTVRSARKIAETHTMTKQIDNAVNGKPPGETTMVQQVQDITDRNVSRDEPDAIVPMLRRIEAMLTERKEP